MVLESRVVLVKRLIVHHECPRKSAKKATEEYDVPRMQCTPGLNTTIRAASLAAAAAKSTNGGGPGPVIDRLLYIAGLAPKALAKYGRFAVLRGGPQ